MITVLVVAFIVIIAVLLAGWVVDHLEDDEYEDHDY